MINFLAVSDVQVIKEAWWMYLAGAMVTVFIIGGSLFFAYKAYKRGKELDMSKKQLKSAVVSSISFSILPSIGIFIGVITMAGLLGVPLPWIRLSVLGALHYELMAVSVAADGVTVATLTVQNFVTIAFVMTIAIIWGSLFALFFFKKYQEKVIDKVKTTDKKSFSNLIFQSVFIGLISAYFGDAFAKMINYEVREIVDGAYTGNVLDKTTFVPLIVFISSFIFMAFFDYLVQKKNQKWLENFQLSLAMILGMAIAVFLGLGGIY
jgi:preprotein translocase subunit SecG